MARRNRESKPEPVSRRPRQKRSGSKELISAATDVPAGEKPSLNPSSLEVLPRELKVRDLPPMGFFGRLLWLFCLPFHLILWPFLALTDFVVKVGSWTGGRLFTLWRRKLRKPFWWTLKTLWWPVGRLCREMPWCFAFAICSLIQLDIAFSLAVFGQEWLLEQASFSAEHHAFLVSAGYSELFDLFTLGAYGVSALAAFSFFAAFLPHRLGRFVVGLSSLLFLLLWLSLLYFLVDVPSALYLNQVQTFGVGMRNELWVKGVWCWIPVFIGVLYMLLCLGRSGVRSYYNWHHPAVTPGVCDAAFHSLRSHGNDPRYRTSLYWALFLHIFIIFIVPLLLGYGCMEDPYGVPLGSGNPVAARVKKVPPVKKKPLDITLNKDSAFIFDIPKLEDSEVIKELVEATENEYVAQTDVTTEGGNLGEGGGTEGGWPHGMKDAKLRFIRLEYSGGDWEQDMGKGADYNILLALQERHKFKIYPNTESRPISQLRRFPKHRAPPFVYITGKGNISLSADEVKTLQWYCLEEKGMIFADNGGGSFNSSFRELLRRVFPGKEVIDIANDDPIFQQPYFFPNGAPPLWHHSGYRALGIKDQGRWCVFYHQGDINDAWKDEAEKILSPAVRQAAFKMGINVIAYSFRHYMAHHFAAEKNDPTGKTRRNKFKAAAEIDE